jgi:hypothetical protein
MLETLRAYGTGLLAKAGEREQAEAALAGYALYMAQQAAAGLQTRAGKRPRADGLMPRTPPAGTCWPGRWSMTWLWRCGW